MGWILSPFSYVKILTLRTSECVFGNIVVVDVITYPDPMTGVLIKRENLDS